MFEESYAYRQSKENRENCMYFMEIKKRHDLLREEYKNSLEQFIRDIDENTSRCEYSKGGEIFHRGYYSPSQKDLVVGGANRGRLLKRTPKNKNYDFEYHFDKQDRLIGVYQFGFGDDVERNVSIEYLFHRQNSVLSIEFDTVLDPYLRRVCECEYENGNLVRYIVTCYWGRRESPLEIFVETIEYTNGLMSGLKTQTFDPPLNLYGIQYKFSRDEEGNLSTYTARQLGFKTKVQEEYERTAVFQVGKRK